MEVSLLKGFGRFLMRGNVVDLAVAVVIGGAFGAIVTALVKDLITFFTINSSKFGVGAFINAVVSFLLVAAAIYFFVVAPLTAANKRLRKPTEEVALRECPECLSDIAAAARRCKFCTAAVAQNA